MLKLENFDFPSTIFLTNFRYFYKILQLGNIG